MDSSNGSDSTRKSRISTEDREDVLMLLKDLGNHIDLEEVNAAFMKERHRFDDKQYKALLTLNMFRFLDLIDRDPDSIKREQWLWLFQTLGYLGIDPRAVLSDSKLADLNELN